MGSSRGYRQFLRRALAATRARDGRTRPDLQVDDEKRRQRDAARFRTVIAERFVGGPGHTSRLFLLHDAIVGSESVGLADAVLEQSFAGGEPLIKCVALQAAGIVCDLRPRRAVRLWQWWQRGLTDPDVRVREDAVQSAYGVAGSRLRGAYLEQLATLAAVADSPDGALAKEWLRAWSCTARWRTRGELAGTSEWARLRVAVATQLAASSPDQVSESVANIRSLAERGKGRRLRATAWFELALSLGSGMQGVVFDTHAMRRAVRRAFALAPDLFPPGTP